MQETHSRTPTDLQVEDEDEPGQRQEDVPPAARLFLAGREEVGEEVGGSHREQKAPLREDKCFCMCTSKGRWAGERLEIGAVGVRR